MHIFLCDWCEAEVPANEGTLHDEGGERSFECAACVDAREAREWAEEERTMTRAERLAWMRARDAGVD